MHCFITYQYWYYHIIWTNANNRRWRMSIENGCAFSASDILHSSSCRAIFSIRNSQIFSTSPRTQIRYLNALFAPPNINIYTHGLRLAILFSCSFQSNTVARRTQRAGSGWPRGWVSPDDIKSSYMGPVSHFILPLHRASPFPQSPTEQNRVKISLQVAISVISK